MANTMHKLSTQTQELTPLRTDNVSHVAWAHLSLGLYAAVSALERGPVHAHMLHVSCDRGSEHL